MDYNNQISRMRGLMTYGNQVNESAKPMHTSDIEYKAVAGDGKTYGIIRENNKYYIKRAEQGKEMVAESYQYLGGFLNKKAFEYSSYANALKNFELKLASINEACNGKVRIDTLNPFRMNDALVEGTNKMQSEIARQRQIMYNASMILNESTGIGEAPFSKQPEAPTENSEDVNTPYIKNVKPDMEFDGDDEKCPVCAGEPFAKGAEKCSNKFKNVQVKDSVAGMYPKGGKAVMVNEEFEGEEMGEDEKQDMFKAVVKKATKGLADITFTKKENGEERNATVSLNKDYILRKLKERGQDPDSEVAASKPRAGKEGRPAMPFRQYLEEYMTLGPTPYGGCLMFDFAKVDNPTSKELDENGNLRLEKCVVTISPETLDSLNGYVTSHYARVKSHKFMREEDDEELEDEDEELVNDEELDNEPVDMDDEDMDDEDMDDEDMDDEDMDDEDMDDEDMDDEDMDDEDMDDEDMDDEDMDDEDMDDEDMDDEDMDDEDMDDEDMDDEDMDDEDMDDEDMDDEEDDIDSDEELEDDEEETDECGNGLCESKKAALDKIARKVAAKVLKEEKLNVFGQHPGYRKKPMNLQEVGSDVTPYGKDWNHSSVHSSAPFGVSKGNSKPYLNAYEKNELALKITDVIVNNLKAPKKSEFKPVKMMNESQKKQLAMKITESIVRNLKK